MGEVFFAHLLRRVKATQEVLSANFRLNVSTRFRAKAGRISRSDVAAS